MLVVAPETPLPGAVTTDGGVTGSAGEVGTVGADRTGVTTGTVTTDDVGRTVGITDFGSDTGVTTGETGAEIFSFTMSEQYFLTLGTGSPKTASIHIVPLVRTFVTYVAPRP